MAIALRERRQRDRRDPSRSRPSPGAGRKRPSDSDPGPDGGSAAPSCPRADAGRGRTRLRRAARRRGRCDGPGESASHARPPRRTSRSTRVGAPGRPRTRARALDSEADPGAPGEGARSRAAHVRRRRHARRRAAASERDLHRNDRVRDRAHRRPREARVAAAGDRVGEVPHAVVGRCQERSTRAAVPCRSVRAVPSSGVSRAEAVLDRRARRGST